MNQKQIDVAEKIHGKNIFHGKYDDIIKDINKVFNYIIDNADVFSSHTYDSEDILSKWKNFIDDLIDKLNKKEEYQFYTPKFQKRLVSNIDLARDIVKYTIDNEYGEYSDPKRHQYVPEFVKNTAEAQKQRIIELLKELEEKQLKKLEEKQLKEKESKNQTTSSISKTRTKEDIDKDYKEAVNEIDPGLSQDKLFDRIVSPIVEKFDFSVYNKSITTKTTRDYIKNPNNNNIYIKIKKWVENYIKDKPFKIEPNNTIIKINNEIKINDKNDKNDEQIDLSIKIDNENDNVNISEKSDSIVEAKNEEPSELSISDENIESNKKNEEINQIIEEKLNEDKEINTDEPIKMDKDVNTDQKKLSIENQKQIKIDKQPENKKLTIENQKQIKVDNKPVEKIDKDVNTDEILDRNVSVKLLNDLKGVYHNQFKKKIASQDMFLKVFNEMINTTQFDSELIEINKILNGKELNTENITAAGRIIKDVNSKISIEKRLEMLRSNINDEIDIKFKDFKRGDKLPMSEDSLKKFLKKTIKIYFNITDQKKNENKIKNVIFGIFKPFGIAVYYYPSSNNLRIVYNEDKKDIKERLEGKIDKDIKNQTIFFSYDIHKIFNIIENFLKVKLTDENKINIESIIESEVRNLRNKTILTHGINDVNKLIEKIENYINSVKRIDSKVFRFSEIGRFRLKEIFKQIIKKHSKPKITGKELMNRLNNLLLL